MVYHLLVKLGPLIHVIMENILRTILNDLKDWVAINQKQVMKLWFFGLCRFFLADMYSKRCNYDSIQFCEMVTQEKNQLFAVFILNSFEQFKILLHLQNMTVLNKFFVLRGVKFPAHGRVGEFRCGSVRSSIHETQHQKKV